MCSSISFTILYVAVNRSNARLLHVEYPGIYSDLLNYKYVTISSKFDFYSSKYSKIYCAIRGIRNLKSIGSHLSFKK